MSTFVPSNWIIPRIYLNLKKRPTFFPQPSVRTLGKTNANSVPSCSGPLCGEQARMPPNGARRAINAGRICPTASLQYPHDYFSLWTFFVILENFCLCLIQRTLGELPNFGVMIWQLYYMLRSALICFQVTRFRNKGNHFI